MNTGRLEAFSDGVIAILITIMVLELKVPHGSDFHAFTEGAARALRLPAELRLRAWRRNRNPASRVPRHFGIRMRQDDGHASPSNMLPSSQSSLACTMPSPQ
jgi:Endosomal/lysosomal potassium channel TMEM175